MLRRAVTARRSIGKLDRAIQVTTDNYDYHYLCPELRRKRMIPVLTNIRAKTVEEFGDLVRHSGEEYIYVLDGRIEVHTEFYEPVVLEQGESIYIDSQMGHAYIVAEGCEEASVLGVCSSSDEGLMDSLMNLHGTDEEAESAGAESEAGALPAVRDLRHGERRANRRSTGRRRARAEAHIHAVSAAGCWRGWWRRRGWRCFPIAASQRWSRTRPSPLGRGRATWASS